MLGGKIIKNADVIFITKEELDANPEAIPSDFNGNIFVYDLPNTPPVSCEEKSQLVKTFRIDLDRSIISRLRQKINSNLNCHMAIVYCVKDSKGHTHHYNWSMIAGLFDRIEDTVDDLNNIEMDSSSSRTYSFYNFLSRAAVLVDCIDFLGKCFDSNFEKRYIRKYFPPDKKGNGTDHAYFKYIRSMYSMHPGSTTDFIGKYQDCEECCPFVDWTSSDNGDLCATIYPVNGEGSRLEYLKINSIFGFIKNFYGLIDDFHPLIDNIVNEWKTTLSNMPLKKTDDFTSYVEYLEYLSNEKKIRFRYTKSGNLDDVIRIFKTDLSKQFGDTYQKFCEDLKVGVKEEHELIQNMIVKEDTILDRILLESQIGHKNEKVRYIVAHMRELISDFIPSQYYCFRDDLKSYEYLNRNFDWEELSRNELYVVLQMALYLEAVDDGRIIRPPCLHTA